MAAAIPTPLNQADSGSASATRRVLQMSNNGYIASVG